MAEAEKKGTGLRIDPRLLQRLKDIELKSRMLVRGMFHNHHRTTDFGSSTEFIEHRDYRWGDDLRSIDWRLLARTDRVYVKRYEKESNLNVHFLLDTSDSMRVRPPEGLPSKLDLAAVIVGAVATMAIHQQDSAGLYCLGDRIEERIPARQGMNHLAELLRRLESPKGTGGGEFGRLIGGVTGRLGKRGMVFVVSDALDDLEDLFAALKNLCAREHDVTLIQVMDRNELQFPYERMTEFRHPESGHKVVGDPLNLKQAYMERLDAHLDAVESFTKRTRIDYLRLHNGEDLVKLLSSHCLRRMMMVRRSG